MMPFRPDDYEYDDAVVVTVRSGEDNTVDAEMFIGEDCEVSITDLLYALEQIRESIVKLTL